MKSIVSSRKKFISQKRFNSIKFVLLRPEFQRMKFSIFDGLHPWPLERMFFHHLIFYEQF